LLLQLQLLLVWRSCPGRDDRSTGDECL